MTSDVAPGGSVIASECVFGVGFLGQPRIPCYSVDIKFIRLDKR